ncbi:MAG: hypothetical protein ABDH28_04350, partial [Brevinematia bacterium]
MVVACFFGLRISFVSNNTLPPPKTHHNNKDKQNFKKFTLTSFKVLKTTWLKNTGSSMLFRFKNIVCVRLAHH